MCYFDSFNKTWAIILYPHCSRKEGGHHCSLKKQTKWSLSPFFSRNCLVKKKERTKIKPLSVIEEYHLVSLTSSKPHSLLSFPSSLKLLRQVSPFIAADILRTPFFWNLPYLHNCLYKKKNLGVSEIMLVIWRQGKETVSSPKDKMSRFLTNLSSVFRNTSWVPLLSSG